MNTLEKIQAAAAKRGMSMEKLAEEVTKSGVKVAKSTIYRWDTSKPNPTKIKAVSDVLGVSVDYLLGNTDTPNVSNLSQHEAEADFKNSLDKAIAYNGKPLSDHDKAVIMSFMATLKAEDD